MYNLSLYIHLNKRFFSCGKIKIYGDVENIFTFGYRKLCLVRLIVRGFLKIQKYAKVFIIEFTVAGQPINSVHFKSLSV